MKATEILEYSQSQQLTERAGFKYIGNLLVRLFAVLGLRKFVVWLFTFLFTTAAGLTLSFVLGLVSFIVSQVLALVTKGTVAGSKKLYQMLRNKLSDDDIDNLALAIEEELKNQPEPDEQDLKSVANTTVPSPKEILDIVKTEQPELVSEADIRAFPTPEDYPIAKMDRLLSRYGVNYDMFINRPFDPKLYELLIDIYMNWEGSRIDRKALRYFTNQYRERGVRAGELPPSDK